MINIKTKIIDLMENDFYIPEFCKKLFSPSPKPKRYKNSKSFLSDNIISVIEASTPKFSGREPVKQKTDIEPPQYDVFEPNFIEEENAKDEVKRYVNKRKQKIIDAIDLIEEIKNDKLITSVNKIHLDAWALFHSSYMARTENVKHISYVTKIKVVPLEEGILGMYIPDAKCILISDKYVGEEINDDLINTIIHETAHHIDCEIRRMSCHDSFWQRIYECCGGKEGDYLEGHKQGSKLEKYEMESQYDID